MREEEKKKLADMEVKRDEADRRAEIMSAISETLDSKARLLIDEVAIEMAMNSLAFQDMLSRRITQAIKEEVSSQIIREVRARKANCRELETLIRSFIDADIVKETAKEEIQDIIRQNKKYILEALEEVKAEA